MHKGAEREESRGLEKISPNCLSASIYLNSMSLFSTWSLRKWCLLSRCLILLWKIGFLATEMALVLPHMRETLSKITPKSLMVCTIHRIWEQRLHTQALWWIGQVKIVFKKTTKQEKIHENDKCQKCSFGQSHNQKSASEKPTRSSEEEAEYQIPNSRVCLIYLKIR
jgi:hypothetical protein